MKEKNVKSIKNGIIVMFLIIFIIFEIIGIVIQKRNLNPEEKVVFNLISSKQNDFRNPSTVKVMEVTVYDEKYAILKIGANNALGAFVSDTYYVKDNTLYTKDNNYKISKEIIEKCFEYEMNNPQKIVELKDSSINKINNKLEKRYK